MIHWTILDPSRLSTGPIDWWFVLIVLGLTVAAATVAWKTGAALADAGGTLRRRPHSRVPAEPAPLRLRQPDETTHRRAA